MMKKVKGFISLLIVSIFLMLDTTTVMADEPLYVYLGEYQAEDNLLSMQVSNNLENSTESISYRVTLGDEELEIVNSLSYEEAEMSASYLFLIDVSGSMKADEMEDVKETLSLIVDGMAEGDNASFMLIGDDAYTDEFVSDKDIMKEKINGISVLNEDTNLYYAIDQALDILMTSESCNARKCLVILSDGQDDQITGITADEVKAKVEVANIPICSIAMRESTAGTDASKTTGSFARISPGGVHLVYGVDVVDASAIAATVKHVVEDVTILQADISEVETNGTEIYLQIEATVEGVGSATDGYNVTSVSIKEAIKEVETPAEDTKEDSGEEDKQDYTWIYIAVATGVAVVVIVVVLVIRSKKKKASEVVEEAKEEVSKDEENVEIVETEAEEVLTEVETEEVETIPEINVVLTRVGNVEDEVREVTITGEIVIGRKADRANLVIENDNALSSAHCKLTYDGNNVCVEDLGSLNGTLVNGVPITESFVLNQDDKLFIGSTEWRISW